MTQPTHQDLENARRRQAIADRQKAEYELAEAYALSLFGPGWIPHGKHSLVTHEASERARREGGRAIATATVITAKKGNEARHFMVEDSQAREVESYQQAFGAMLTESDPNRTIEVRGERVHPHLYELHWSGFEADYTPKTAEQLAAARDKRQEKKEAKERKEYETLAAGSLFPEWIMEQAEEKIKGRKR